MHLGYHFTGSTLRDGRPLPAIGETLVHDGEIIFRYSGLHWSEHPFDALQYAPGPLLHRVACSAPVDSDGNKYVSRERTIVATIDATGLLRRFAADQALSVAHLWGMPPIVRNYLTTLDDELWGGARVATWAHPSDAAKDDAWTAALAAAWAHQSDAARDAARADFRVRVEAAFA